MLCKSGVKVFKNGSHILTLHSNQDMINNGFDPRNVSAVLHNKKVIESANLKKILTILYKLTTFNFESN